tara:strand:- start:320 stop:1369 length:1050 start_codon:yes stop_codon:yes gene_type:complete
MILFYRNPIFWMLFLLISLIVVALFFSAVLTPFISAAIFSYLLVPVVNRLENFGLPRAVSCIIILLLIISFIATSVLLVLPIFLGQVGDFISSIPEFYNHALRFLESILPKFISNNGTLEKQFLNINEVLSKPALNILSEFASYAFVILDLVVIIFVVPVITFYLLVDWNRIIKKFADFLPIKSSEEINDLISQIDSLLSGFVRGQLLICSSLGIFYSVSLSIFGLSYGLLIGLFAGLISFIPFIGAILGALIAVTVAIYQFWDMPTYIAYVSFIFLAGQILESNFLTPKLIGDAVRLHPLVIMLSISIGGAMAGLSGIMLAIPVAGVLAVLLRKIGQQYFEPNLDKGA